MQYLRLGCAAVMGACLALAGCGGGGGGGSVTSPDARLDRLIADNGLRGVPQLREPDLTDAQRAIREKRRELGRQLFFDHALSGVEQTSCGTCHHAAFQFADGRNIARGVFCELVPEVSITCEEAPPDGTGGNVVGPDRTSPLNSRNSPSLINSALYPRQMWNGRFRFNDIEQHRRERVRPRPRASVSRRRRATCSRARCSTAQAHIPVTELVEMTGDFPRLRPASVEEPEHAQRGGARARSPRGSTSFPPTGRCSRRPIPPTGPTCGSRRSIPRSARTTI